MNKKTIRIAGWALGLSMAVAGIGVAVGTDIFVNDKATMTKATDSDSNPYFTINLAAFAAGNNGTNPTYSSGQEFTFEATSSNGIDTVTIAGKYIMANSNNMQCQANNANIYNKTAFPGRITSIVLNQTGTVQFTAYGGASQLFSSSENGTAKTPTGTSLGSRSATESIWTISSGTDYDFFAIHKNASAGYVSSIIVHYEEASGNSHEVRSGTDGLTVNKSTIGEEGGEITLSTDAGKYATNISVSGCGAENDGWMVEGNVVTIAEIEEDADVVITGTISDAPISEIAVEGQKTSFRPSDEWSFGGTVTGTYGDWHDPHGTVELNSGYTVDYSEFTEAHGAEGTYNIYVTYPGAVGFDYEVTIRDVVTYTLVDDVDILEDGTKFVLTTIQNTKTYVSKGLSSGHAAFAEKTDETTISNGTSEGSTLESTVADFFVLEGTSDAWKIKYGDSYLKFTGNSNGNDAFDTKANASTFSASIKDGGYILFTCTSATGNNRVWRPGTDGTKMMKNYGANSGVSDAYMYANIPAAKTIADTRLTTNNASISANVGDDDWDVSGFQFEVQYEGESSWNVVDATYTVTEEVPTSYDDLGSFPVHFKVTYKGNDYYVDTPFTANVVDDMTPISDFYDGTVTVTSSATSKSYTYRGTVIAIEGNSYYLQQGDYGLLVYGGSTPYPTGMKVGDLVAVTSKIINYNDYVVESSSITKVGDYTCKILGTGTLPAAPIVTTVADFQSQPQSTRVTFNGLSRNDEGETITWLNAWSEGSSHGVAQVKDSTGATTYLYISKYLSSLVGNAIVSKINEIGKDDTFDVFQGVMAVNTNSSGTAHAAGTVHLSITDANQITIHAADADPVLDWIDAYMYLGDPRFDGDGTGLCNSQNFYLNAKAGLRALEQANNGSIAKFRADAEGDYTDALLRYTNWAIACNDGAPFDGNADIQTPLRAAIVHGSSVIENAANSSLPILLIAAGALVTAGGFFLLSRKRREEE